MKNEQTIRPKKSIDSCFLWKAKHKTPQETNMSLKETQNLDFEKAESSNQTKRILNQLNTHARSHYYSTK